MSEVILPNYIGLEIGPDSSHYPNLYHYDFHQECYDHSTNSYQPSTFPTLFFLYYFNLEIW